MPKDKEPTLKDQDASEIDDDNLEEEIEELESAEQDKEEEEQEAPVNPNDLLRAEIAKRHEQQRQEDLGLDTAEEDEDLDKEEDASDSDDIDKSEIKVTSEIEDIDDDPLVTIKINGKEQQIKQSELVAGYQIDTVARQRLREAENAKQKWEAEAAALEAERRKFEEEVHTRISESESTDGDDEKPDFTAIIKSIREGEEDDAEEAIETLYNTLASKRSPVKDIETLVERKLREKEDKAARAAQEQLQQEAEKAREDFQTMFEQDLKNEADFWNLAVMEDNKLQDDPEWTSKPLQERYIEAGKRAKKWFGKTAETEEPKKKKKKTTPVRGRNARANLGEDEKIPTPSDIIKDIAKSRGQTLH